METFDCTQWKYRAEGNKHIVVSNEKGQVLRLQKSQATSQYNGEQPAPKPGKDNVREVLRFQEFVALPLMKYSDACHISKEVQVSSEFANALNSNIQHQRPESRRHKDLKETRNGLLMFDHCFIPINVANNQLQLPLELALQKDTISIEIKPKRGFILHADSNGLPQNVCQFCLTQLYRVKCEKRFSECSHYCPVDLFSGDKVRIKKAISALLSTPQNNFRLFKNGHLSYSQETIKPNKSSCTTNGLNTPVSLLTTLLESFICSSLSLDLSFPELCSTFIDLICEALLLPVLEKQHEGAITTPQYCCGHSIKGRPSKLLNGHSKPLEILEETSLPSNCILGLILAAQKLNVLSISDVMKLYDSERSRDNVTMSEVESNLDGPYTAPVWKDAIKPSGSPNHTKGKAKSSKTDVATKVRRFLVSKSFCDCSIMISLRKIHPTKSDVSHLVKTKKPTALCNVIRDRLGNFYLVSIAVVDMDPKSSSRIPFYFEQNKKLADWWKLTFT